ncbi:MAG: hypothetical protein JWM53_6002 [bacterium]|nr:hypothetical protein [bacterium]
MPKRTARCVHCTKEVGLDAAVVCPKCFGPLCREKCADDAACRKQRGQQFESAPPTAAWEPGIRRPRIRRDARRATSTPERSRPPVISESEPERLWREQWSELKAAVRKLWNANIIYRREIDHLLKLENAKGGSLEKYYERLVAADAAPLKPVIGLIERAKKDHAALHLALGLKKPCDPFVRCDGKASVLIEHAKYCHELLHFRRLQRTQRFTQGTRAVGFSEGLALLLDARGHAPLSNNIYVALVTVLRESIGLTYAQIALLSLLSLTQARRWYLPVQPERWEQKTDSVKKAYAERPRSTKART